MAHQHLQLTQRNAPRSRRRVNPTVFLPSRCRAVRRPKVNAGSLCLLQLGEIGRCQSTPVDFQPLLAGRL
ncbi:Uncharacterised protein [Shigella sonnei]|nr:Uncharacterised protein [Shigella sonnei]